MQQEKTDIKSMNLEELKSYMESIGEKPFRAKQLYQWMHEKQAASFDEMTNLSKSLQEKLKKECHFVSLKQEAVLDILLSTTNMTSCPSSWRIRA